MELERDRRAVVQPAPLLGELPQPVADRIDGLGLGAHRSLIDVTDPVRRTSQRGDGPFRFEQPRKVEAACWASGLLLRTKVA